MKSNALLITETPPDIWVLGIVCQLNEVLFITKLNSILSLGFFFSNDLEIEIGGEISAFFQFKSESFDTLEDKALVISNKNRENYLIPKIKQFDFIMITNYDSHKIYNQLKNINDIQLVVPLKLNDIKPIIKYTQSIF